MRDWSKLLIVANPMVAGAVIAGFVSPVVADLKHLDVVHNSAHIDHVEPSTSGTAIYLVKINF